MKNTYEIKESRLEVARAEVEKANKRAAKVGAVPVQFRLVRKFEKTFFREDATGRTFKVLVPYVEVEVEGENPKFEGWTFLATLDHSHETGTVVRAVPGADLPERFWTSKPVCDHCQTIRRRKDTYVIQHDDGTIKQVGSGCIQDFLGGKDPHAAIAALECIQNLVAFFGGEGDDFDCGPRSEFRLETLYWVRAAVAEIRQNGYTSRAKSEELNRTPTSVVIANYFFATSFEDREVAQKFWASLTDQDQETAQKVIEWAKGLQVSSGNEFLNNVKVVCSSTTIGMRDFGIASAAVLAYNREEARRAERELEGKVSNFVGEEGKRSVFEVRLVAFKSWDGNFGTTFFHKFADAAGNIMVWFGSSSLYLDSNCQNKVEVGTKCSIKGTVKKHEEYKGVKQTVLSRVAVYVPPVKKPRKPRAKKVEVAEGAPAA